MSAKAARTCFVISPIGEPDSEVRRTADQVLKHIVRPAVEELGYKAVRADRLSDPGLISKSILRHVLEDELVVADLSGHNPNVFYELAVRHSAGKPVIQIISAEDRIPFDVADTRTVQYTLDLDGVEEAKSKLKSHIEALESGTKVETPVSDVLRLTNIEAGKSPDSAFTEILREIERMRLDVHGLARTVNDMFTVEARLVGKIEEMLTAKAQPLSVEERLGLTFVERLFENPEKAEQMMATINALSQMGEKQAAPSKRRKTTRR